MAKKKVRKTRKKVVFYVIEQSMDSQQRINRVAMSVLQCMEGRVSDELLEMLREMLLGFSEDMQLEIAVDLIDFVTRKVVHTTGCIPADAVLDSCYQWIADEKGFKMVNQ